MEYSPETIRTRLLDHVQQDSTCMEKLLQKYRRLKSVPLLYYAFAITTVVLSVISMIRERKVICVVAFSIPLFTAPYTIFLCGKINDMKIGQSIDNDELIKKKEELEQKKREMISFTIKVENEAIRKQSVKNSLNRIALKCGVDTIELLRLVQQNRHTSEKIMDLFKGEASQLILQFLLDTDANENFEFDDTEIEILIVKFSVLHFCDIDADKFRSAMHAMKGKKIVCFGKLAKDIYRADFDKYGLAFNLKS